jgi:hypothetical protein
MAIINKEILYSLLPETTNLEEAINNLEKVTEYDSAITCLRTEGNVFIPGDRKFSVFRVCRKAEKAGINVSEIKTLYTSDYSVKGYVIYSKNK